MHDNMNEPFEGYGTFCLVDPAGREEQEFHGQLKWDPHKGATIEFHLPDSELSALLFKEFTGKQRYALYGQLDSLPCICLENVMLSSARHTLGTTGGRFRFHADEMLVLHGRFMPKAEMLVTSLTAEMTGLLEWTRIKTIETERTAGPEVTESIRCGERRITDFAQIQEGKITIQNWNRPSSSADAFEAHEAASVEIALSAPVPLSQALQILTEFRAFLAVALDRPVILESISGRLSCNDSDEQDGPWNRVRVYRPTNKSVVESARKARNPDLVPFWLEPVAESVPAFLRFRELFARNSKVFSFFLSPLYNPASFTSHQFADVVHGLEGLQREVRGATFMDQQEYDTRILPQMLNALPIDLDTSHLTALKNRLKFGNGKSLRRILKDAAKAHPYTAGLLGKACTFADIVADERNTLAHALSSEKPSDGAAHRHWRLMHEVRMLFQLELLSCLGFSGEFLEACAQRLDSPSVLRQFKEMIG